MYRLATLGPINFETLHKAAVDHDVYYQGRRIQGLELLAVEKLEDVFLDKRVGRTAKTAEMFPTLNPQGRLECPHCKTRMNPVKLGARSGWYCPSCRHCDFDPNEASTIDPGKPSVDKIVELACGSHGNCTLKQ